MAYRVGNNRLFYTSTTAHGKTIKLDILTPELKRSNRKVMKLIDDIYYVDVVFQSIGSHFIRVFEDDVLKHNNILVVTHGNLIVYPD